MYSVTRPWATLSVTCIRLHFFHTAVNTVTGDNPPPPYSGDPARGAEAPGSGCDGTHTVVWNETFWYFIAILS